MEATKTSSWPWKRKASTISDSLQPASAVVDAKLQGTKQSQTEDKEQCLLQQQQQVSSDHAINHTMTTTTGTAAAADLETTKLQILSEQLIVRDELVQQHANVAEDAILGERPLPLLLWVGWHKAEREAAGLRQQLEKEIVDKVSLESQVVQLSETLKSFRAQLQRAQHTEHTFREAVAAKTQNLDELHTELQAALSRISSESLRAAKEVDARIRAEARVNVLQATVEVEEREKAKLKHELKAMSEELEKQEEEWTRMRKATEMQHRADAKRITQLENECGHLRRRLQAAAAQTRKNSLQDLPTIRGWEGEQVHHSAGGVQIIIDSSACQDSSSTGLHLLSVNTRDADGFPDEKKKKEGALPSARFTCARSSSAANNKLSYGGGGGAGGLMLTHRHTRSVTDYGYNRAFVADPADLLFSALTDDDDFEEDESICAESWASALISELAQLKKKGGKGETLLGHCPTSMASCCPDDLMEDFEEMEMQLASLPSWADAQAAPPPPVLRSSSSRMRDHEEEEEEEAANHKEADGSTISDDVCKELSMKLVRAQDELKASKLENLEMKATLAGIERHLLMMLQAAAAAAAEQGGQDDHHLQLMDRIRAALESMCCSSSRQAAQQHPLGTDSPEIRDIRAWSPSGQSSQSDEDQVVAYDSTKQLFNAVHQFVCLLETLPALDRSSNNRSYKCRHGRRQNSDLRACIGSLMVVCDGFLNEKVELHNFLVEAATALQWVVKHVFSSSSAAAAAAARQLEFGTVPLAGDDDDAPSPPISNDSTEPLDQLEHPALAPMMMNPEQEAESSHESEQHQYYCSHNQIPNDSCEHRPQQTEKEDIDTRLAVITEELETLKLCILSRSSKAASSQAMQNTPPSYQKLLKQGNETTQGSSSQETDDSEAASGARPSDSATQFGALQTPTGPCCESLLAGMETATPAGPIEEEETPACTKQEDHEDVLVQEDHEAMPADNPDANACNYTSLGSDEEPNALNERHLYNEDRNSEPSRSFSRLSPEITVRASPYDRIASSFSAPASPTALDLLIKSPGKFLRMRSENKTAGGLSFDKQASKLSRFFSRSSSNGGGT